MRRPRGRTLLIDDQTHQELKEFCQKHGFKLNDFAQKVIKAFIKAQKDKIPLSFFTDLET